MRALVCLLLLPQAAIAQSEAVLACGEARTAIAWTQPPRKDIEDTESTRWPVDATLRIAFGGTLCPSPDEFELYDEHGAQIPAQVRVETPNLLVAHDELPVTLVEIDPLPHLAPRTSHTLVWRAPEPKLTAFRDFTLEFKTLARTMEPLPLEAFEGAIAVQQQDGPCGAEFGNPVVLGPDPSDPPGCLTTERLQVQVRFEPLNRRDVAYLVERTRSVPLDDEGEPIDADADTDPVTVALLGGGEDFFATDLADVYYRVAIPASPLPRRDCFAVHLLDARGLPVGGEGEACIDLPFDLPCVMDTVVAADPLPDPSPVLSCDYIGLNGADPRARPPQDPDPSDEGGADGDGGKSSSGCCRVAGAGERAPWPWALAALAWGGRRRRR